MKSHVSGHFKAYSAIVFNLQASEWTHCEEETGVYYHLSRNTYKLVKKIQTFKIVYFANQKTLISKNSVKFSIHFFSKRDNWAYVYVY